MSPEVMQMARAIARKASEEHGLSMTYAVAERAAALAIVQTSELAAKLAEEDQKRLLPRYTADRLRTFSHLPTVAAEKADG